MKLIVERYIHAKDYTISHFYINGKLECFGVEDEFRAVKVKGETRIPDGLYEVGFRNSPRFSSSYNHHPKTFGLVSPNVMAQNTQRYKEHVQGHPMIWIKNVPNFEFILLHWGNTDDDTDGCYIVGKSLGIINGQQGVTESRLAYISLYPEVMKAIQAGGVTIEYRSVNQNIVS
jgi:hypothetical protein